MNKTAFIQKGLIQKLTWLSLIWIVLYSTWVFWAFWRTLNNVNPYSVPSNPWVMLYGFWYWNYGWGYWYGYWYWYGESGYYANAELTSSTVTSNAASQVSIPASSIVTTQSITQLSFDLSSATDKSKVVMLAPDWVSNIDLVSSDNNYTVTIPTNTSILFSSSAATQLFNLPAVSTTSDTLNVTFWNDTAVYFSQPLLVKLWSRPSNLSVLRWRQNSSADYSSITACPAWTTTSSVDSSAVPSNSTYAWADSSECWFESNSVLYVWTNHASTYWYSTSSSSSSSWGSSGGSGWWWSISYNSYTNTQIIDNGSVTTKVDLWLKDWKTVEIVTNNLNSITFKTEKYTKAIDAINTVFVDEVAKAELTAILLWDSKIASSFANDYINFLNALKSYESKTISKDDLKVKLAAFVKSYSEYKDALKQIATVTTKSINNTKLIVVTPKFDNADVTKAVNEITKRFEKYLMKKTISWASLKTMYNNYSNFLLWVKVMHEENTDLWKSLAKKYLWELTKSLIAQLSSK